MIDRVRTFSGYREYPSTASSPLLRLQASVADGSPSASCRLACFLTSRTASTSPLRTKLHDVVGTHRVDPQLIQRRKDAFRSYQALSPPRCSPQRAR